MDQSGSRAGGGREQASPREHGNGENERQRQQERLSREEAYYQFINELNDEDYRIMRDHNLLGTPGKMCRTEVDETAYHYKSGVTLVVFYPYSW